MSTEKPSGVTGSRPGRQPSRPMPFFSWGMECFGAGRRGRRAKIHPRDRHCSSPGGRGRLTAGARLRRLHLQAGGAARRSSKTRRAPPARPALRKSRVAEPDGHTILCSISTTYVMNRVMMKNPGYDMHKDLALVSIIPGAGLLLIASTKSGVKSLDDFVAFARKSGKMNFGTYGAGSSPHITINELNKQYGLNIDRSTTAVKRRCGRCRRTARSMSRWAATRPRNPSCKATAHSDAVHSKKSTPRPPI